MPHDPGQRSQLPRDLRPFIDETGRLGQWPARQKVQRMAVAWIARRFEAGRDYREREVNEVIMDGHTFADWALLRRSLIDWGYMRRESDGSRYRLDDRAAEAIERELGSPGAGV
jgi:hypothetical protein